MKKIFIYFTAIFLLMISSSIAKTSLEWWQFWTDPTIKPVINKMITEFETINPDIEINVTDLTWSNGHEKIVIAFSSGTAPDIVELGSDWIAQFASKNKIADITKLSKNEFGDYRGWNMATYNDKIYAKPWFLGTRVIFYNKTLLKKAGFDDSFIPYKWDDLKNGAREITALGKKYYGWGSNTAEKHRLYKKFMPFFWSNKAQLFTDDNKFCVLSSIKAIEAIKLYAWLHDSCGYVDNQRGIEDAFLDGKIGFIISGDWLLKRIELEKRRINFGTTLIPGPTLPGRSFLGGEFLAISENSKNKEAAKKFIDFITSAENQIEFCKANRTATPSSKLASQDEYFTSNPNLLIFNKQIHLAVNPPVDPDWVKIEAIIEEAVEEIIFNTDLIAEPLLDAQRKIEKIKGIE
ncbi:MAG: hypothetical protein DRP35_02555 [Candidatus Zixiibacteriota bacterium]|nr:MAG: hypothetical protein DRP35_02555 [candidate division Zixibacteria bacterium]